MEKLELQVFEKSVGILKTNIDDLEKFVEERIKEYEPTQYQGDVDSAKKDRAELNNAKKQLATVRKDLITELMKPYADVENRLKKLEKSIEFASGQLDEIVKTKENEEKHLKKMRCEELWLSFNFSLFPLEKVFNQKWLNKTTKEADILKDMKAIIDKTYKDLKIIEQYSDNAELLKTRYLENLDIGEIFSIAEEMKKNNERIKEEESTREKREKDEFIANRKTEIAKEQKAINDSENVADLVNQALEFGSDVKVADAEPIDEYVVSLSVTEKEILRIEQVLLDMGFSVNSVKKITF